MKLLRAVVLSGAAAATLVPAIGQTPVAGQWIEMRGGAWPVDADTLAGMRNTVQQAADKTLKESTPPVNLQGYVFQYQGIVQGKDRQVRLQGMCKTRHLTIEHLTRWWPSFMDGGVCYFEALYDPATTAFLDFSFNSKGG